MRHVLSFFGIKRAIHPTKIMSTIAHISLAQYEIMIEHGVFDGKHHQRVELIRGEILQMNPIGVEHANVVDILTEWSVRSVPSDQVRVRIQNPILLPDSDSAPEPDVVWVVKKQYTRHPLPDDVLLLIEVADSTLEIDRGKKAQLYAEAGIQDYWIVNLVDRSVEVMREPSAGRYRQLSTLSGHEEVHSRAFPDIALKTATVLGLQGG